MTKVINFFGVPSSGKSTIASGLFHELKKKNYSVEYVSEYAKDVVYDDTHTLLENQLHIFSEQFRRQYRLLNKVDYIITDSPLLLSIVYLDWYDGKRKYQEMSWAWKYDFREFIRLSFTEFDNINFYLHSSKDYDNNGRIQRKEDTKVIDEKIKFELNNTPNCRWTFLERETGLEDIFKQNLIGL